MDEREENLRDAMKDEAAFDDQCPVRNGNGEACAFTSHAGRVHSFGTLRLSKGDPK